MSGQRIAFLFAAVFLLAAPRARAQEATAYVHPSIFDATGGPVVVDGLLVVRGDRIVLVGTYAKKNIPKGAKVVDLTGKWVVPGLVDSHIHFFQSGGLYTRPDIIDLRGQLSYDEELKGIKARLGDTFKRYLASGVTAVVDVGGPFWNFQVRREAADTADAPRVAVAGPLVSTVARPQLDLGDPPIMKVETEEEARKLVRRQLEHKPDLIKIWFILPESGDVSENLHLVKATIDEAHAAGVRVAVHATELETARASIKAGADILVHSVHDALVDAEFVKLLKESNTIYTTTLVVYEGYGKVLGRSPHTIDIERRFGDPWVIRSWSELGPYESEEEHQKARSRFERMKKRMPIMLANLKTLQDAGVTIAMGTDAGNIGTVHGPSVHREFELMVEAGLSPQQILIAATRNAALVFSPEPEFGTLQPGKYADLLILNENPLASVDNFRRVHRVVKGGKEFEPDRLVPPSPEDIVQWQVDAYAARDIDDFLSFYAEDAKLYRFPSGEVIADGREAMRPIYKKMFDETPDLAIRIIKRTTTANFVVDYEFVTGIEGRPLIHAVAMYEVTDGLIVNVWFLPK